VGLADHWETTEADRQRLVPPAFGSAPATRLLRVALVSRVTLGIAVLVAVVALGVGGRLAGWLFGVSLLVALLTVAAGAVAVGRLARIERPPEGPMT
jgi:hypothetical protein